jgi:glycine oxidase
MKTSDVIVVGGGVVGASVAYHLAREGLTVTLFERDDLAAHASGAAAGMLAPLCEADVNGPLFGPAIRSLEAIPGLVPELKELSGVDPQYVQSGILRLAHTAEEASAFRREAETLAPYGVEWIDADTARAREPQVSPELHGALWSPREGHVFSPMMTRAYAQAAVRLGATVRTGDPVLGLIRDGDQVLGVKTTAGQWGSGHVVLAAGVWSRYCAEWLGERLPVEPVRGQILALEQPRPPLRGIVWSGHTYLVPKLNGTVVVGATEERTGFDRRVTASAVAGLIEAAARAVPALADSTFLQAWSGLRPDTPDHLPVIGPVPGAQGVVLAAGHYRNGVLLSPFTGQAVADWIIRRDLQPLVQPFLPERLLKPLR